MIIEFTTIKGVIYKSKDGISKKYPYYMATVTTQNAWVVDCYPVNEHGRIMPGYTCPIPVRVDTLGEPINLNIELITNEEV